MVNTKYLQILFVAVVLTGGHSALVAGCFRQKNFQISYLLDQVPHENIKATILSSKAAGSQMYCGQICLGEQGCATAIYSKTKKKCILLKSKLRSIEKYRTTADPDPEAKLIVLQEMDQCSPNPCHAGRHCVEQDSDFRCSCAFDEKGKHCDIKLTGTSCKEIKNKFSKYNPKNGNYRLASLDGKESFTAYCDMEFDQGGWTQVVKVESNVTSAAQLTCKYVSLLKDFNVAENYLMTSDFLQKFRNFSNFKEIRFQCDSYVTNTKVHVKTNPMQTAVVDYFVGASDTRPNACGTFTTYADDNSYLSKNCGRWQDGKWGDKLNKRDIRFADHPMFIYGGTHFLIRKDLQRFECDNFERGVTTGDFWRIYVR